MQHSFADFQKTAGFRRSSKTFAINCMIRGLLCLVSAISGVVCISTRPSIVYAYSEAVDLLTPVKPYELLAQVVYAHTSESGRLYDFDLHIAVPAATHISVYIPPNRSVFVWDIPTPCDPSERLIPTLSRRFAAHLWQGALTRLTTASAFALLPNPLVLLSSAVIGPFLPPSYSPGVHLSAWAAHAASAAAHLSPSQSLVIAPGIPPSAVVAQSVALGLAPLLSAISVADPTAPSFSYVRPADSPALRRPLQCPTHRRRPPHATPAAVPTIVIADIAAVGVALAGAMRAARRDCQPALGGAWGMVPPQLAQSAAAGAGRASADGIAGVADSARQPPPPPDGNGTHDRHGPDRDASASAVSIHSPSSAWGGAAGRPWRYDGLASNGYYSIATAPMARDAALPLGVDGAIVHGASGAGMGAARSGTTSPHGGAHSSSSSPGGRGWDDTMPHQYHSGSSAAQGEAGTATRHPPFTTVGDFAMQSIFGSYPNYTCTAADPTDSPPHEIACGEVGVDAPFVVHPLIGALQVVTHPPTLLFHREVATRPLMRTRLAAGGDATMDVVDVFFVMPHPRRRRLDPAESVFSRVVAPFRYRERVHAARWDMTASPALLCVSGSVKHATSAPFQTAEAAAIAAAAAVAVDPQWRVDGGTKAWTQAAHGRVCAGTVLSAGRPVLDVGAGADGKLARAPAVVHGAAAQLIPFKDGGLSELPIAESVKERLRQRALLASQVNNRL